MKINLVFPICLFLVGALAACTHEIELVDLRTEAAVESQDDQTIIFFTAKADTASVTVQTDGKWTVEAVNERASSWLSFSPESGGKGDTRVKIDVTENVEYEERSAVLHFRSGKKERIIQVVQKPYKAFLVSSEKAEFGPSGGKFEVKVTSNVAYSMSIEDAPWLHQILTKGVVNVLEFQVDPTDRADKRIGRLVFSSELGTETVMVYQTGVSPEMVLSENDISVPSEGCQVRVDVSSNFNAEYSISADWIHEIATKAVSTNTFYFYVERNPEYDARTTEIVFFDAAKNLSGTVTIHQAQQDAIVIQNELKIDYKPQVFNLTVGSNVDVTMTIPEQYDWLVPVKTRGLTKQTLSFNVTQNHSKEIREADIILTSGDLRQSVRVKQMPTTHYPRTIEEIRESERISLSIGEQIERIVPKIGDVLPKDVDMESWATSFGLIDEVLSSVLEDSGEMITIMKRDSTIIRFVKSWGEEPIGDKTDSDISAVIGQFKTRPSAQQNSAPNYTRKAVLLSPFQNSFVNLNGEEEGEFDIDHDLIQKELDPLGIKLEYYPDDLASLDKFTGDFLSDDYDYIIISSHGGNPSGGWPCTILVTGNAVGDYPEDKVDLYNSVEEEMTFGMSGMRYVVTSTWMNSTFSKSLNGAIVYVGACHSYEDDDLKDVFVGHDAGAYYGYAGIIRGLIDNQILYSISRSLSRGMEANDAYSFCEIDDELHDFTFNLAEWLYSYSFHINPEAENAFLVDPRPRNLKSIVRDNIVTLTWDCDFPSGDYEYIVKIKEEEHYLPPRLTRSLTVPISEAGTFPWSVRVNINSKTTESRKPVVVASYETKGEPFTIQNTVSVVTDNVMDISIKKATVSAHYSVDFDIDIVEQGVVYSTVNTEPTTNGSDCSKQKALSIGKSFRTDLTGLNPLTKYYARAYMIVGKDEMCQIYYGNVVEFTTNPIENVIPPEILDKIDDHITIYDGINPPNVEGQYLISPIVITYDSTDQYALGSAFIDLYFQFLNQDMENNTLDYYEVEGSSTTVGTGAFISGEGDKFSVFFNTVGTNVFDDYTVTSREALVISGIKTPEGIRDICYGFVLVEKSDDPVPHLIEEGSYRVFSDSDGLSANTSYFKSPASATMKYLPYNPSSRPNKLDIRK